MKFFLTGMIVLVFCTLFLVQNSFTSLDSLAKSTTSSKSHSEDKNKDNNNKTTINTIQSQPTKKTASDTNIAEEKQKKYNSKQNSRDVNNKQQTPEEEKIFPQQLPEKLEKDTIQDIKSQHGEIVIKKIKNEKSVTVLTTDDKRTTGVQMSKGQTPAVEKAYIDNKDTKASTGIQLPNHKQQPVSTESYIPDLTAEPRY